MEPFEQGFILGGAAAYACQWAGTRLGKALVAWAKRKDEAYVDRVFAPVPKSTYRCEEYHEAKEGRGERHCWRNLHKHRWALWRRHLDSDRTFAESWVCKSCTWGYRFKVARGSR